MFSAGKGYMDILQMGSVGWRKAHGIHIYGSIDTMVEGIEMKNVECKI